MTDASDRTVADSAKATAAAAQAPFAVAFTADFPDLLLGLGISLAISTYQSGKVILLSAHADGITQLPRTFAQPMGLAVAERRLAVATRDEVVVFADAPELAGRLPRRPGVYSDLYLPRATYYTGPLAIHDLAWARDGRLWAVATACSCLATIDDRRSFTPEWKPPFVTTHAPVDACHLNGLALEDGRPRYVTALAPTDAAEGWREHRLDGGVVVDVPSGEVVASGLAMPHSPRVVQGRLLVLDSARCELVEIDRASGARTAIASLPGFARGMAFAGDHLFIGLSKLRHSHRTFGDLPIARAKALHAGVVAVHLPSGRIAGELRYLRSCEEIYDVQALPGVARPNVLAPDDPTHRLALDAPGLALWGEPARP